MPDPIINKFAEVAYTVGKTANNLKETGKKWGRGISTKLQSRNTESTSEKIRQTEKRLSTEPLETKKMEESPPIAPSEIPEGKTSEKTRMLGFKFFYNLISKFKKSYQAIKRRDRLQQQIKSAIISGKKPDDLNANQREQFVTHIASASKKELEETLRDIRNYKIKNQSNHPLSTLVFETILTDNPDIAVKLMENPKLTSLIIDNFRTLYLDGKHDEVLKLLNKHNSPQLTALFNALFSETFHKTEGIQIKDFTIKQLEKYCESGELSIKANQKLFKNIPSEHLQSLLEKVWEDNPPNAITVINALYTFNDAEISEAISSFLNKLDDEQIKELSDRIYSSDDPKLAVDIFESIPNPEKARQVVNFLISNMHIHSGYEQTKFFTDIALEFIKKDIESAEKLSDVFDEKKIGFQYLTSLQTQICQEAFPGLPASFFANLSPEKFVTSTQPTQSKKKNLKKIQAKQIPVEDQKQVKFNRGFVDLLEQVDSTFQSDNMPHELTTIYRGLQREIDEKFPSRDGTNGKNAVLELFINKYVVKALVSPQTLDPFINTDFQANLSENAIEYAKVFQQIAANEEFPNDSYLAFMNDPIKISGRETFNRIYDRLIRGGQYV